MTQRLEACPTDVDPERSPLRRVAQGQRLVTQTMTFGKQEKRARIDLLQALIEDRGGLVGDRHDLGPRLLDEHFLLGKHR